METSPASDTWIIISTVVQAASAVAIAVLTVLIVRFTRKHVREAERVSGLSARAHVLDGLPLLVISSPVGDEHGVVGHWKNVGHGPALNIELGIEHLSGGGNLPLFGRSMLEHDRWQSLAQNETMPFQYGRAKETKTGGGGWTFLARYEDTQGNQFVSRHTAGYEGRLTVTHTVGGSWRDGEPLADFVNRLAVDLYKQTRK